MIELTVLRGEAPPKREEGGWSRGRPYFVYALQRLAQAVVVIILAYVLSFVLITILPGNPIATVLGNPQSGLSPAQVQAQEAYYGVTKPVAARSRTR